MNELERLGKLVLSHVMISYSHEDKHFVAQLAAALKARKYEVWFDDGLRNSEEFSARIHSKIVDARAVVVVWSNKARESQWVRAEAQQAFNLKKPLIQVIKEPSSPQVPFPFAIFHYTDLSDWNFDSSAAQIEEIVAAIELPREPSQTSTAPSPAPVPQEIARFLDNKAKIRVIDRIAVGDLFEVYRGEYGKRLLAIKAVRVVIPTRVKQELLAEVALASNLNHPSFLRISDVLLDDNDCYIIVDYVHGSETVARRMMVEGAGAFSVLEVVNVLDQLCEAIVEAEVVGLHYLSITPSQIFVRDDRIELLLRDAGHDRASERNDEEATRKIVRLSPINFVRFKAHFGETAALWDKNYGAFMAPEFWRGSRWFKQRMEAKLGIELSGEALRRAKLHRSHQFAVGMLAWTMLEGRVPFSPHLDDSDVRDMDRLKEIEEEFLEASEGFSQRVSEARWRVEARALARIIQRMVAHNPAERWSSMDQVRSLVHALAGNYAADELDNLVKEAYQTVACGNSEFYHKFYETLFQNGPHLRAKFPSDMNSQHRMLDYAVGQLFNFNQQQSEPSTLTQFVERHRQLGLSKDDFENFGNALLGTFDAALSHAGKRQRMLAALEIVIWPGIYYMIQHCAPH